MRQHLGDGVKGSLAETPKPSDPCFSKVTNVLIGSADLGVDLLTNFGSDKGVYLQQSQRRPLFKAIITSQL